MDNTDLQKETEGTSGTDYVTAAVPFAALRLPEPEVQRLEILGLKLELLRLHAQTLIQTATFFDETTESVLVSKTRRALASTLRQADKLRKSI